MQEDDFDKRLGTRVRAERKSRGWSLDALAARASVSRAMIHKIETGESSPTANMLGKLSGALGVSISTLIARAEGPQSRLARQVDQPVWVDPGSGYRRRHVSPGSDLPIDLVEVALPAKASVPMPTSAYAFLRQLIWVLEGELVFMEGDVRHVLAAGDCRELGPPQDCVFVNEAGSACRYAIVALRTG